MESGVGPPAPKGALTRKEALCKGEGPRLDRLEVSPVLIYLLLR